jgi:hypothetical protein
MTAGRKPHGETAMTGAERQALYRARLAGQAMQPDPPSPGKRRGAAKLPRPARWRAAITELLALQNEYAAWLEALPDPVRDTPTGEALQAIVELDLDEIASLQLPRGYGRD